ncbi:MAG: DUF1835 domain-containing protein [Gammaproteobacteria bacterium]|nr:DUF1835 domain-containing protein [Gammaproteobacteria bacterium]
MLFNLAALREQRTSLSQFFYEFAADDPRRLDHLSLEQQKKRAKELLRQLHAGDPPALVRAAGVLGAQANAERARLSDAQLVIAREHGFSQWTGFKAHIEQTQIARAAVATGTPTSLDDERTLHIRCGSDITHALAIGGFSGDFLAFPDPYIEGPVPKTESREVFVRVRSQYLAEFASESAEYFFDRINADFTVLDRAKEYSFVNLWFEHDSYDQLILARLLDYFSEIDRRPPRLRLISVTHFPGVRIFNGIGQLPPEALRVLWDQFTDVTDAQFELGRRAWDAITSPTPELLAALINTGTPALPTMAKALVRHLRQLPSVENGLNLTEQLTLQIVADKGAMNAARLFGWYCNHYEPLPFMGDTSYWRVISGLAKAPQPALIIDEQGDGPKNWQVELTPLAQDLLHHRADWLALNPVQCWVGGIKIDPREPAHWRCDAVGNVVRRVAGSRQ